MVGTRPPTRPGSRYFILRHSDWHNPGVLIIQDQFIANQFPSCHKRLRTKSGGDEFEESRQESLSQDVTLPAHEKRRTNSSFLRPMSHRSSNKQITTTADFNMSSSHREALQQPMRKGTKSCLECEAPLRKLVLAPR